MYPKRLKIFLKRSETPSEQKGQKHRLEKNKRILLPKKIK